MGEGTFVNDLFKGDPFATVRRQEQKAADAMSQEQRRTEKAVADQKAKEEAMSIEAALRSRNRLMTRAGRGNFNRGTILTSPIGLPGNVQTGGKTILGS